nr:MAG TPA: hypothetical protein [Siphoviridae sp. ctvS314]
MIRPTRRPDPLAYFSRPGEVLMVFPRRGGAPTQWTIAET